MQFLHHYQDIGTGFAHGVENDGRRASVPDDKFRIFKTKLNAGNIAHSNRNAVYPLYDDIRDIFGAAILADGSGDVTALALVKVTGTDVFVLYIQGSDEFRNGYFAG